MAQWVPSSVWHAYLEIASGRPMPASLQIQVSNVSVSSLFLSLLVLRPHLVMLPRATEMARVLDAFQSSSALHLALSGTHIDLVPELLRLQKSLTESPDSSTLDFVVKSLESLLLEKPLPLNEAVTLYGDFSPVVTARYKGTVLDSYWATWAWALAYRKYPLIVGGLMLRARGECTDISVQVKSGYVKADLVALATAMEATGAVLFTARTSGEILGTTELPIDALAALVHYYF